ncbi:MAG TPA: HD domain-containing phosphohydrolase [Pyrinomonadaceae bacterium]|jgi:putative nucleotidyltransferase with HDIG domain
MKSHQHRPAARAYQAAVAVAGVSLWLWALARLHAAPSPGGPLVVLALAPVVVFAGLFTQHFRIPLGHALTRERLTFSLSDAIVLLVAYWGGLYPAICVAGLDGFITSRRTVRRWSSNLFSFGMMSLVAAVSSLVIRGALAAGGGGQLPFHLAALAFAAASVTHNLVNTGLLSTLLALRHARPIFASLKESFLWTAPLLCLPTTAAAVLMHHALEHGGPLTLAAVAAPTLIAVNVIQRQNRRGVEQRVEAVEKAHRETVEALAVAINAKDQVTHEHVLRVQIYAAGVARLLGCTEAEVEALRAGALLHDIGKIAVPDYILNKPGKLTADEFEKMKAHTLVGAQILGRVDLPYPVAPVVRHHHERWDGRGYPDGLKGDAIPLTARILSVVDCFDAVREDRQYRKGMTREEAIALITQGAGTQYDPRVVATFVTHLPEFEAEILAMRNAPVPTYGIEPAERLSAAASQVAPAAGLAEEVQAANLKLTARELNALGALARRLEAARPDRDEVVRVFLGALAGLVPFETCAVALATVEGEYVVAHAAGAHAELLRGRRVRQNDGVTGWVLANQQPFCNTSPQLDLPEDARASFAAYRTLAAFPVTRGGDAYGALTLYSASLAQYTAEHRRLVGAAADALADALAPAGRAAAEFKSDHPSLHNSDAPAAVIDGETLKLHAPFESDLTH